MPVKWEREKKEGGGETFIQMFEKRAKKEEGKAGQQRINKHYGNHIV